MRFAVIARCDIRGDSEDGFVTMGIALRCSEYSEPDRGIWSSVGVDTDDANRRFAWRIRPSDSISSWTSSGVSARRSGMPLTISCTRALVPLQPRLSFPSRRPFFNSAFAEAATLSGGLRRVTTKYKHAHRL